MKMRLVLLATVFCTAFCHAAITTSKYFTSEDRKSAHRVLKEAYKSNDIAAIHYGALGLIRLEEKLEDSTQQCARIFEVASDAKVSAELLYHATIAHKTIGNCKQALPVINIVKALNGFLAKDASLQELFHSLEALISLGQKPADPNQVLKTAQALLKKNDALVNYGYFFHITAGLGTEAAAAAAAGFTRIEDAIVQADEVDSKFLQFDGGLSTTALILNGAYRLAAIVNKNPGLSYEQTVKFANYFISRRSVLTAKGVTNLLQALNNLSTNKFQVPVSMTLASNPAISADSAKIIIRVGDVLGNKLVPFIVTADSLTRMENKVVVLSKTKFYASADTMFTLDISESRPDCGQYKLTVNAIVDRPDTRIPSTFTAVFNIHVLTTAVIDFVDVGAVDADQITQGKLLRVPYTKSAEKAIEADAQQKLQLRFNVKDKATGQLMTVHQAFLRFTRPNSKESVTFVAEPDNSKQYKLDLDLGSKSGDFGYISGHYDVELIIGDALLVNSFAWKIGQVNFKFSSDLKPREDPEDLYSPKPEIKHLFREPEKRPARFVSDLFSILAALPLLILLVAWAHIRVNVSNLSLSLWTLLFHLSLASIFVLFGLFWVRLNMFETIRYLCGVGAVAFLSGNKVLRNIAANKK